MFQPTNYFLCRKLTTSKDDEPLQYRYTLYNEVPSKMSNALFFTLQITSEEDIRRFRERGDPGFILKRGGNFYYTSIPFESNVKISNGNMVEALDRNEALAHADTFPGIVSAGPNAHLDEILSIESGYETVNTIHDVLYFLEYRTSERYTKISTATRFYQGKICRVRVFNEYLTNLIKNVRYKTKETTDKKLIATSFEILKVFYTLKEVVPEDLPSIRRRGLPGIVIKTDGRYYYSPIKEGTSFDSNLLGGVHKCCCSDKLCSRLSALSDEEGGCSKVRDRVKRIEDYPQIKEGFEVHNNGLDESFIVNRCEDFSEMNASSSIPRKSPENVNRLLKVLQDLYK